MKWFRNDKIFLVKSTQNKNQLREDWVECNLAAAEVG